MHQKKVTHIPGSVKLFGVSSKLNSVSSGGFQVSCQVYNLIFLLKSHNICCSGITEWKHLKLLQTVSSLSFSIHHCGTSTRFVATYVGTIQCLNSRFLISQWWNRFLLSHDSYMPTMTLTATHFKTNTPNWQIDWWTHTCYLHNMTAELENITTVGQRLVISFVLCAAFG